jgi:hypothetical protein
MLSEIFFELDFVGVDLVLVLLSFEKSANTNTIPAIGFVFQYNTYCSSVTILQGVSKDNETGFLLNSSGNKAAKFMMTYFLLKKTFLSDFRKLRY